MKKGLLLFWVGQFTLANLADAATTFIGLRGTSASIETNPLIGALLGLGGFPLLLAGKLLMIGLLSGFAVLVYGVRKDAWSVWRFYWLGFRLDTLLVWLVVATNLITLMRM